MESPIFEGLICWELKLMFNEYYLFNSNINSCCNNSKNNKNNNKKISQFFHSVWQFDKYRFNCSTVYLIDSSFCVPGIFPNQTEQKGIFFFRPKPERNFSSVFWFLFLVRVRFVSNKHSLGLIIIVQLYQILFIFHGSTTTTTTGK